MKAAVCRRYGPPELVDVQEVAKPVPKDNEVLIKVLAASVNPLDWHWMRGRPYPLRMMGGLSRPRDTRLGIDFAGVVEAAGARVVSFKSGDEVFGMSRGAFAEHVCVPESPAPMQALVNKPPSVSFEEAAAIPVAGLTALQALRDKGRIQAGSKVLINGASGGVGTFAIQIAKSFGAEVTGVCSARNAELIQTLGADRAIDYAREDFTSGTQRYDLLFDCMGNHSILACRRVLNPHGVYVVIGGPDGALLGPVAPMIKAAALSPFVSQKLYPLVANPSREDLAFLAELIGAGKLTPVIDRRYKLSEISEAIRYLETGRARGKVVISSISIADI